MKRVLVLVEGQTEEQFVKGVLAPYFWPKNISLVATVLVTKRVKDGPNFKGGVTKFAKFENDVRRLLQNNGGATVTTFVDYYGLPSDFPGMNSRPTTTPIARVEHVEKEIGAYFGNRPDFIPFLALHEFEALLFSDPHKIAQALLVPQKAQSLIDVRMQFGTPEDINERPTHAPSKRISSLVPAYRKVLHGPIVGTNIGLNTIRKECGHFHSWIDRLEQL